jgi:O-acetyl-ADP-ribose deacetylase (regulator of RNase III)
MKRKINGTTLLLKKGDLTLEEVDAIVNAANTSLLGGGGVDGAIHHRGGPAILEECKEITRVYGPLPTGQAVVTTGGQLAASHVIHTAGPIWTGGESGEDRLLRDCYLNALSLALEKGFKTVAFPSISTGAYRYPVEQASRVALGAVREFLEAASRGAVEKVIFVLFSDDDLEVYRQALENEGR